MKELRIYPQFEPNDNTNVSCPLPLSFAFAGADGGYTTVNITLSPLDASEDVEEKLKQSLYDAGISTEIRVAVEFFGDRDSQDQEVRIRFLFISVTALEDDIPEITVNSDQSIFDCVNLNNETDPIDESVLSVRVELYTVQNLTVPDSFKIGYENLNIMSGRRFTNNFPVDVTADRLQSAVFDLFGWGCSNQSSDQLRQQIAVYQTYENMDRGGANGELDVTTSFCGHGSLRSPRVVWIGTPIDIGNSPFQVSPIYFCSMIPIIEDPFHPIRRNGGRGEEREREREVINQSTILLSFPIQICFAYKGDLPNVWTRVSFQQVDPNTNIILSAGFRNLFIR